MYRVLIIEDDRSTAQQLRSYVEHFSADRGVELACSWLASAVEFAAEKHPADLILMDIQLPGINGLEAAEILRGYDEQTPVVFVTNLAQYAVRAYRVDALDFIVKPVRYHDFCMAMDRAVKRMRRNDRHALSIPTKDGLRVVDVSDVAYVDVRGHSLSYHLGDGQELVTRDALAAVEARMDASRFTRASKSCLVNMAHVRNVCGDELLMSDGATVYLGRTRKRAALADIAAYLGGSM